MNPVVATTVPGRPTILGAGTAATPLQPLSAQRGWRVGRCSSAIHLDATPYERLPEPTA